MNIAMFYERTDAYKIIKALTYQIGNIGAEIKSSDDNRQDIDIARNIYDDAKYIRKEIQVSNQEMYYIYIYVNIYSEKLDDLELSLRKIEGVLQSIGIRSLRANFREDDVFLACTPMNQNSKIIKEAAMKNILTNGLVGTYPFISSNIFDDNGIYMGNHLYDNSLILIDRYNYNKYKNANMCIFGTSGSGKSFFTKLMIIRNRIEGIKQYIVDPEREVRQEVI